MEYKNSVSVLLSLLLSVKITIGGFFMGRNREEVKLVGNQGTKYVTEYCPDILEAVENRHQDRDYFVKFNCPEFTSLCPITGQPDFATIYISYIPDKKLVESKALKL